MAQDSLATKYGLSFIGPAKVTWFPLLHAAAEVTGANTDGVMLGPTHKRVLSPGTASAPAADTTLVF